MLIILSFCYSFPRQGSEPTLDGLLFCVTHEGVRFANEQMFKLDKDPIEEFSGDEWKQIIMIWNLEEKKVGLFISEIGKKDQYDVGEFDVPEL